MIFWLALALMTAAAIFAVLWPLAQYGKARAAGSDLAVYRDQLDEIDRDRVAGRIGDAEADAARLEVSRRLLAAADQASRAALTSSGAGLWRRRILAVVALILLPASAASFYLVIGSPGLPSAPQAARLETPPEQRSIESLLAQVEKHLEGNPDDGRGWEVVAPVYLRLGRFADAVKARANALRLLGANAEREADFGEALVAAANGVVTADAKAAFDRARKFDATDVKAQYFLGLAAEQDGRKGDAATMWQDLLKRAPQGAPWIALVKDALGRVDASAVPRGPSAEDMAAASGLTPEQRSEMVRGMVDRLAERLKNDGTDLDGWVRLVRAYLVLGQNDRARAAASDARRALASDPEKLRNLNTSFKELGLDG
ncbi:MAG: c-type cytochrome biogenesis protein CcmI [Rhizobiales bacterium]|nr:c-type cytochrome biogenesis protein CcmI [Hyphomicrobiales bacterium]